MSLFGNITVPEEPAKTTNWPVVKEDSSGEETVDKTTGEITVNPPVVPHKEQSPLDMLIDKFIVPGDTAKLAPLKMLIYSDPGIGKTSFLGGIPGNLIVDTEKGRITIDELKRYNPDKVGENVQVYPYKSFEGLEFLVDALQSSDDPRLNAFTTVSIDTLNGLHKRGLAQITEREFERNPTNPERRFTAVVDDHAENNERIRRLVQSITDLDDRNIIFTAHVKRVEPKNGPDKIYPDFSERLANTIAAMVDIVGYMHIKEIEGVPTRVLQLEPVSTSEVNLIAKNRLKKLPAQIIEPTWEKIWNEYTSNH